MGFLPFKVAWRRMKSTKSKTFHGTEKWQIVGKYIFHRIVSMKRLFHPLLTTIFILSIIFTFKILLDNWNLKEYLKNVDLDKSKSLLEIEKFRLLYNEYYPSTITRGKTWIRGYYDLRGNGSKPLEAYVREIYEFNCGEDAKIAIFIISHPDNFYLREQIRHSFGGNNFNYIYDLTNKQNITNISHCFFFSIGYVEDDEVNRKVDKESYLRTDIIRVPLVEGYRITAHKIILTIHLLHKFGTNLKYIIKADDDILLKIRSLVPYVYNLPDTVKFVGHLTYNATVIRDPKNKWHVSKEDHPNDRYSPYAFGSCYAFHRSIIPEIVNLHYITSLIPMEDVHLSYLVAKSGYELNYSERFYYSKASNPYERSYIIDIGRSLRRRAFFLNKYKYYFETKQPYLVKDES